MTAPPTPPEKVPRCPTCRKPAVHAHRPFCSRRCADIDLARWLGGGFVIHGATLDVADDTVPADAMPGRRLAPARDPDDDSN